MQESLKNLYNTNALTPQLDHMSKLMFVVSRFPPWTQTIVDFFSFFFSKGFLDVIIATEVQNQIVTYAHMDYGQVAVLFNQDDPKQLYPDHLKDMHGYNYRVLFYNQMPKVKFENGHLASPWNFFLIALAEKQNAKIHGVYLKNRSELFKYFDTRQMDFTINSGTHVEMSYPQLLTYEETGYCALIPMNQSKLFFFILIEPFDWKIWLAFFVSLTAAAMIWRLFKKHRAEDSALRLVFGILAFFLGQSVAFRNNHRILMTVLQIFIFAMLILGCLYQGQITSSMIDPNVVKKITTFDELFDSDLNLIVDQHFDFKMRESEGYLRAKSRANVSGHLRANFTIDISEIHATMVMPCYLAEYYMLKSKVSQKYYLLDDRILSHYNFLLASYMNPFLERLQLLMDWSFEAGLPYAWNLFATELKTKFERAKQREYLELEDFSEVFCILAIGLTASTIVFFMEIFVHWHHQKQLSRVRKIYIIGEKRKLQIAQAAEQSEELKTA